MSSRTRSLQQTGGFTLIEVLVSLMILSVGTVALSALLLRAAKQATAASALVYQNAALSSEVGAYEPGFAKAIAIEMIIIVTVVTVLYTLLQRRTARWL